MLELGAFCLGMVIVAFVVTNPWIALSLGFTGYMAFLALALIWGAWKNPKITLIVAGIIGFVYVMPMEATIFAMIATMVARIVWVVRDWLSEPVYAPQRRIKVRAAR